MARMLMSAEARGQRRGRDLLVAFFCAPEILHPISGFEGGYPGFSAM